MYFVAPSIANRTGAQPSAGRASIGGSASGAASTAASGASIGACASNPKRQAAAMDSHANPSVLTGGNVAEARSRVTDEPARRPAAGPEAATSGPERASGGPRCVLLDGGDRYDARRRKHTSRGSASDAVHM